MIVRRMVALNLMPLVLHRDRRAMPTTLPPAGFCGFRNPTARQAARNRPVSVAMDITASHSPRLKNAALNNQSP